MLRRLYLVVLRDLFAVFAPKKPQKWHRPKMRDYPAPIWPCSGLNVHKEGCHCIGLDLSEENWQERAKWRADEKIEWFKQWPYAWADAMLRERVK